MILPITEVEHYTDKLFRIRTERPRSFRFTAGEFTMIGLPDTNITRAYSFTSGPGDDYIEFYSIKVDDGPLTSALQHIKVGDSLEVSERTTGTLTLANIELGGDLWLLATGTGIAPFVSILRDPSTYDCFENIHVAWSVRTKEELLGYSDFLNEMPINFTPIVTQDKSWTGLNKRITTKISSGVLLPKLDPSKNKVMICGSIDFNTDIKSMLTEYNWAEGSKRSAGTFVQEKAFVEK